MLDTPCALAYNQCCPCPPCHSRPGRKMAEFPVDPMLAKMIIQSEKYGVSGARRLVQHFHFGG